MIGISTRIYDPDGARIFRVPDHDNLRRDRRMTRTATLDAGVSIYDTGYSAGDRDITVRIADASRAEIDWMLYSVKTYTEVVVTTSEGAFLAVPGRAYMDADGTAVMILNIIEEIGG